MTEDKILDFRERVQPRLRDYLKAAHIALDTDEFITACPICGDIAGLMKDDTWLCMHCGKRGDLLDYVLLGHPNMKPTGAVRHIQRMLGETVLELDAVNANDLMEMAFKPTGWLIEKMLGKGVYILAGVSKIGKSWLVLWLADRVSKGEKGWEFQTKPCEVLYVSLEDTEQRIQQRLGEVTGGEADKIWIATEAELLGKGFEQQIGNFLTAHPNVGFVIVDTLQRIRQMKTEGYSYGGDYEVMTSLKTIADRFNITILVVHVKTVQGNLGHATAAFTLDVYGHVSEAMKPASANRMERFRIPIASLHNKSSPPGMVWQREKDSNPHIRSQSPLCYLYTIPLSA